MAFKSISFPECRENLYFASNYISMKKLVAIIVFVFILLGAGYYAFVYYLNFSEGYRAGELIKISNKGVIFKTWEGEISQGVSESQRFVFSIEDKQIEVIEKLKNMQGKEVNLTYIERFGTFPWLGDTKYFITKVDLVNSSQENRHKENKTWNGNKNEREQESSSESMEL